MQIIVLGPHRSGTSLVTRLINLMGAYFAPEKASLGFDKANPKGYWERRDVMNCNNAILQASGCSWCDLAGWPEDGNPALAPELKRQMKSIILDMDAFRPWVMKDPRLCLTLPSWKPLLEVPVAVLVYRDPLEVARSLEIRDNFPPEFGVALWEFYAVHALNASLGMPRVFLQHAGFLAEAPVATIDALLDDLQACGVRRLEMPSSREIEAFVDSELYRSLPEGASKQIKLTQHQRMLSAALQGDVPMKEPVAVSAETLEIIKRYSRK